MANLGTFDHQETTREHYIYLPPNANAQTPLFVALNGLGRNAKNLRFGIGLTKHAEQDNFAVLFPQGLRLPQGSRHWNAGFSFSNVDDLGYLDSLIEHIFEVTPLNRNRLTILGISNGGYMAYRMACHSRHPIHAVAIVAGTMSQTDWKNCPAPNPVSVLHIHGTDDPMIHFTGIAEGMSGWDGAPAVPILAAHWAEKKSAIPAPPITDYKTVKETCYQNPTNGSEVQMLALKGFGHDWPNLSNRPINALDYVMKFVDRTSRVDYASVTN
ncbi:MAG: PHB depolymerase family esterase [Amylibacter sp.]